MEYIIFAISMIALVYGANYIIIESERIALHFNISSFVIGATLIAIGTSLPELATSVTASIDGKTEMAVANVLGSITFNIGLVLGIIFLLVKNITPKRDLFLNDSAWSLFPLMVFFIVAYNGNISRFEGFMLLLLMVGYLIFLSKDAKSFEDEIDTNLIKEKFKWLNTIIFLLIGFTLVIVGANYTIQSASTIARSIGVSEWVISLILIAFGTSLPELVVSIAAARKNNADLIVGNIIGSNIANITIVLGSAAIANPLSVNFDKYGYDILCASTATVMLVFITANKLYNKSAGIALLSIVILMLYNSLKVFF